MDNMMLSLQNITSGYGEAVVIDDVSFEISDGSGMALLGRNGVGKSTLIQTVMGLTRHMSGLVFWQGQDITALPAHERARRGIGWVPQERDIFHSLTVAENLTVIARKGHWDLARIYRLFPRLKERETNKGNQLSGGEQQMLAIGRTLMTNPSILLLDEPLEGLAPIVVQELNAAIANMRADSGMAVVLAEQHADAVLDATDTAIILERGQVAWAGASPDLQSDPATLERLIGLQVG